MADRNKSLPTNVPGDFFVDSTCINCDTCQWVAPGHGQRSKLEPQAAAEQLAAVVERMASVQSRS